MPSAALSDSANFSITMNNCSAALAASATCTIKARFNPGSTGSKLSSLTVMASPGGAAPASLNGTGISPAALTLTPATQDLGSLVIGTMSSPFAFTVRNTGASPSGMITPTLASTDFAIASNGCTGTLAAGATCSISVQFTAAAPMGAKTAMLSVAATPGGTAMSTVTGTAITVGNLSISPATHPFGNVLTGAMSAEQTFTVTNNGGSATTVPATTLSDTTNFTLTMNNCTAVLNAGASCTVKARFNPTTVAAHNATLQVAATTGGTAVAQLSGTGQAPATLSITPATRDFGPVTIGQSAGPLTFTISNVGNSTTGTITAVVGDTTHYMVSSTCTTLAPGANCTASVTYTASGTAGAQNSTIMVSSTPGGTVQSSLTAQAITVSQLAISPMNPAAFASVVEGGTGATQMFTITNNGGSASGIPSVGFATATNDFTITNNQCLAALSPSGTCTVSVRFNPSVAGNLNANLRVSASPGGIASAMVSGIGLRKAALSITPSTQDFGMVVTGMQSAFFTFTVTNTGEVASSTVAVALATSPSDFAIDTGTNTCTTTLLASGTCTVRVRMTAGTPGAKSNTLQATAGAGVSASSALTGTSLASGALEITPTSGAFGSTLLNTTAATTQMFTVRNMGGSPTGQISMSSSAEFPIMTDNCTTTLAAGAMCTVVVNFRPTVNGARTGSVTATASPGGAASASLTGTGQNPADLTITSSASLNFGTVVVGQTATQTITVRNAGDVSSGVPTKVFMPTTDYTIMSDSCTVALPSANQCSIVVRFTAGALGTSNATIDITASPGGTERVTLTGESVAPGLLTITPSTWAFGSLVIGDTGGTPKTFVVRNTGGVNTGTVSTAKTGDYIIDSTTCGAALAPNATCDIVARFQPTAAGSRNGSVTASATPGGDAPATLSGTGLTPATLEMTPATQDFGTVTTGTASVTRSFTVQNIGGVATSTLSRSISGGNGEFLIDAGGCASALAPGAMCTISVTYTAAMLGSRGATLSVSATTGGSDSSTLTATAVAPGALTITGNTTFPTTAVGATSTTRVFTITNTGGTATGTITITPPGDDFTITSNMCGGVALNPGASCTVSITMTPTTAGSHTTSFSASASPSLNVGANLSGTGSATLTTTTVGAGTLTFNPNTGVADCGTNCKTYTTTGTVTITAVPDVTTDLDFWSGNCSSTTSTTCTVDLNAASRAVTANFKLKNVLGVSVGALAFNSSFNGWYPGHAVGTISPPGVVTITNNGSFTTGPITVGIAGAHPSDFGAYQTSGTASIPVNCGTLIAGGTCVIRANFKPTLAGNRSATIQIAGAPGGTVSVSLTGIAFDWSATLSTYTGINTLQNEQTPMQAGDASSRAFYWSSNTSGTYDIWYSTSSGATPGVWSAPTKHPLSSTGLDEFHPYAFGNHIYYSDGAGNLSRGIYNPTFSIWTGFDTGLDGFFPTLTSAGILFRIDHASGVVVRRAASLVDDPATPIVLPGDCRYYAVQISPDERGVLLSDPTGTCSGAGSPARWPVAQAWRNEPGDSWGAITQIPSLTASSIQDAKWGFDGLLVQQSYDLKYVRPQ